MYWSSQRTLSFEKHKSIPTYLRKSFPKVKSNLQSALNTRASMPLTTLWLVNSGRQMSCRLTEHDVSNNPLVLVAV